MIFEALQTCPCWGGGSGMGGWGMDGSGAWGFGWLLLALLIVAVIAVGAAYLFTQRSTTTDSNRAMDLLRERYARGEISDEEFEERSSRLSSREPAR